MWAVSVPSQKIGRRRNKPMAKAMQRGVEWWGANLPSTAASPQRRANGQQDGGPFSAHFPAKAPSRCGARFWGYLPQTDDRLLQ
jgi:hypothetical protein